MRYGEFIEAAYSRADGLPGAIRSGQGLEESGQEIEMTAMRTLKQDFETLAGATERLDSTMLTHADTFHDARDILKTLMPIM